MSKTRKDDLMFDFEAEESVTIPSRQEQEAALEAERVEGKPKAMPEVKPNKRAIISVDNSPQEVLKLDKEGLDLYFDDTAEGFLDLPQDVQGALSSMNRTRYTVASGVHARMVDERDRPENFRTPGLDISGRLASATSRLEVRGKTPGWHYCWKRPDELRQSGYEGYQVASEKELETFGSGVGTTRTVGERGDTELVLMKIPQDVADQRQRAVASKSRSRVENIERSTVEDIRRSGGKPLEPQERDGRPWS